MVTYFFTLFNLNISGVRNKLSTLNVSRMTIKFYPLPRPTYMKI